MDPIEREIRDFLIRKAPHQRAVVEGLKPGDTIWGPVDSLLILGLVSHLEKTYGFKVNPKDFTPENLATIERIAAFTRRSSEAARRAG